MSRPFPALRATLPAALAGILFASCAVNPATGHRQFMIISESREIAMGRQYDPEVVASMGLYGGDEWQSYIQALGSRMAALTERPDLPWTFRVVDDPIVNAFAIPGGFVYVTRGILAHFTSEAQLASVLGHEIGHVTARHSAAQMSRQSLLQGVVGAGSVFAPNLQSAWALAGTGVGILSLKFSRDDESQADQLGLRYIYRAGFDPRPMPEVYTMLGRISAASGSRTPEWLSTHPDPGNREQRIRAAIAQLPDGRFDGRVVNAAPYLHRLEGMVFGQDPRNGFFEGMTFKHPDLAFTLTFPDGWRVQNQSQAVVGINEGGSVTLQVTVADETTAGAAARRFFAQDGIDGSPQNDAINGLVAVSGSFTASTSNGTLLGTVSFVVLGGRVYQLVGFGTPSGWRGGGGEVQVAIRTFARLTDPAALAIKPRTLHIVETDRSMTIAGFRARFSPDASVDELARINQVDATTPIPAGTLLKAIRR